MAAQGVRIPPDAVKWDSTEERNAGTMLATSPGATSMELAPMLNDSIPTPSTPSTESTPFAEGELAYEHERLMRFARAFMATHDVRHYEMPRYGTDVQYDELWDAWRDVQFQCDMERGKGGAK